MDVHLNINRRALLAASPAALALAAYPLPPTVQATP